MTWHPSARIYRPDPGFFYRPGEDVRALIDRNLIGTMLMCRAVMPGMLARRAGSVVNVASAAAHIGVSPEAIYSTIKAAIVHYTRCLAAETKAQNVRVNCLSPGATATARFKNTRLLDPAQLVEDGSLMRYGAPRDQANAVAFLCSDAAKFIHGQVLRVDGGFTLFARSPLRQPDNLLSTVESARRPRPGSAPTGQERR